MPGLARMERPSDREVVFVRLLDAPQDLAWKIWTDPRYLHQWFGPDGFTTTTHEFAFVPGGVWRFTMHGPDGTDYPNLVSFREIVPPVRLVYENGWDLPGAPLDFAVVVTLEPEGARTRLAISMTFADAEAIRTAAERYGVLQGGVQTVERIAAYLARLG
ncbi:MAG: SRPBCC family protein [Gemmatimonadales bacterium]